MPKWGNTLLSERRPEEDVAENERALALNPAMVDGLSNLGFDYQYLGQFEKSLGYLDKAIRLSPRDPKPGYWSGGKAEDYFALKHYDDAIEWARRSIAISPNYAQFIHATLVAALTLTGRDADAHEALQGYLALPTATPKTIAAWKAYYSAQGGDPPRVEANERTYDGLRKAGMPEE
jgi:adenylate cyclase